MNEQVEAILDVAEQPVTDGVFVQHDGDYPVDPIDRPFEDGVSTAGNEVPTVAEND